MRERSALSGAVRRLITAFVALGLVASTLAGLLLIQLGSEGDFVSFGFQPIGSDAMVSSPMFATATLYRLGVALAVGSLLGWSALFVWLGARPRLPQDKETGET